jgi:hypothetical protein
MKKVFDMKKWILIFLSLHSFSVWAQEEITSSDLLISEPPPAEATFVESKSKFEAAELQLNVSQSSAATLIPIFGLTYFGYAGEGAGDTKTDKKISGGFLFDLGRSDLILETGLMVLSAGAKTVQRSTSAADIYDVEINTTYLAAPILAKFYGTGVSQNFYIKGGAMPALLLAANARGVSQIDRKTLSRDVSDSVTSYDLVAVAGVGAEFVISPKSSLVLDATYNRGLINAASRGSSAYNQGVSLFAGFTVGLEPNN